MQGERDGVAVVNVLSRLPAHGKVGAQHCPQPGMHRQAIASAGLGSSHVTQVLVPSV